MRTDLPIRLQRVTIVSFRDFKKKIDSIFNYSQLIICTNVLEIFSQLKLNHIFWGFPVFGAVFNKITIYAIDLKILFVIKQDVIKGLIDYGCSLITIMVVINLPIIGDEGT